MRLQIFDGYELRTLDCTDGFGLTWLSAPLVRKGMELRWIGGDLYEFLDLPDETFGRVPPGCKMTKAVACFPVIEAGGRRVLLRAVNGLLFCREGDIAQRIVERLTQALASGEDGALVRLNGEEEPDPLELISPAEAAEMLAAAASYRELTLV